ncbi:HNH endonuclease signature motif containing protein [Micromonospora sp. NPDC000089]|uniref:HNH endonuclease signature motif containing protein n=1 Tax=unclassified Micromonospora TaxID=2617518 RepID=UPI0036BED6C2
MLRDAGCAFPGCDRPPRWCDGHHVRHWADGGETALNNAVLLCGHHHRLIHQGDWTVRIGTDRRPEFLPPAWLDPHQHPRRNHLHRKP